MSTSHWKEQLEIGFSEAFKDGIVDHRTKTLFYFLLDIDANFKITVFIGLAFIPCKPRNNSYQSLTCGIIL